MARRVQPTLFDYMVVAINPALIMILIGSLVYFLLELAYQGQYPARLHYCLTLFIFGAVLIARISMEEGWERAAPFGAALALVVGLALNRFVDYKGSDIAAIGWIINYSMMALTWWCAQRLTWDCTLVDDSQDASGEGLLQTVGLDKSEKAAQEPVEKEVDSDQAFKGDSKKSAQSADDDDLDWAVKKRKADDRKSWWQRFVARRRRPHAPGVWIVYFSLAALPLFGIGQVFIPASNTASRQYAFLLLCIYVASGLGLLLTTSFLGLRRYLRQRRLEMPLAMAGLWLATGSVLIVGLLLFAALIPRPNAEYAISELPISMDSPDRGSSKVSVGKEGTKDQQAESGSGKQSRPERASEDESNSSKGSGEDTSQQSDSKSKDGETKNDAAKSKSAAENPDGKSQQKGESKQTDQKGNPSSNEQKANSSPESKSQENENTASEPPPQSPSVPEMSAASEALINAIKWIFYGVVVLVAGWWAWNHRAEVLAFLIAFLTGWWNLWGLFGNRTRSTAEVAPMAQVKKSFNEYSDPFSNGNTTRWSAEELVKYSFEALEAWARDQGVPREGDQTAFEFARALGARAPQLTAPARVLADLYSRTAYSPGSLPANAAAQLQPLWQAFHAALPAKRPLGVT